eukprot:gene8605-10593_t
MSFIGPARPPQSDNNNNDNKVTPSPSKKRVYGPTLNDDDDKIENKEEDRTVKRRVYGPSLDDTDEDKEKDKPKRVYGPSLNDTNENTTTTTKRVYGPSLHNDNNTKTVNNNRIVGPTIGPSRPSNQDNEDDSSSDEEENNDEDRKDEWSRVRGSDKDGKDSSSKDGKREDWMKSLPTDRRIGSNLQNRQFSTNSNVNVNNNLDTSSWTDTPQERLQKEQLNSNNGVVSTSKSSSSSSKQEFERMKAKEEEKFMNQYNDKYRKESLLEMHQKKQQQQMKKDGGSSKKPSFDFDRERDLNPTKVDTQYLKKITSGDSTKTRSDEIINNNSENDHDDNREEFDNHDSYQIHKPVLIREVIERLKIKPGGIYIDGTFGLGGHSRKILETCDSCYVIGIDRDPSVFKFSESLRSQYKDRLITLNGNFGDLSSLLQQHQLHNLKISGILYDFGVSSYQIDSSDRGFSFKKDIEGPLDMRMNNEGSSSLNASHIVNTFSGDALRDIFYYLGEEKHTKKITEEIISRRAKAPILTTLELVSIIEACMPYPAAAKTISKIFRALRMFVNDEIGEIKRGLLEAQKVLKPGGQLVAISFHSIEDRIAKQFLARCASPNHDDKFTSQYLPSFEFDEGSAPVLPKEDELRWNSRSRSAVLRSAKRTTNPPLPDLVFE